MTLHAQEADEVVPLKECFDDFEAVSQKQLTILFGAIWNEHVLERLALSRDLDVGVAAATLEIVVSVDEVAIELGMLGQHLLSDQQDAIVHEAIRNPPHQTVPSRRTNELQG